MAERNYIDARDFDVDRRVALEVTATAVRV